MGDEEGTEDAAIPVQPSYGADHAHANAYYNRDYGLNEPFAAPRFTINESGEDGRPATVGHIVAL